MSPLIQFFATILAQHCAMAKSFPWEDGQEVWAFNLSSEDCGNYGRVMGMALNDDQVVVYSGSPFTPYKLTAHSASSGSQLWAYAIDVLTDVLTDSKGDLIFGSAKSLHKVSKSGEPLFKVPVPCSKPLFRPSEQPSCPMSIALDKDDNIYVGLPDHGLLSLDSAGKPLGHLWRGDVSVDASTASNPWEASDLPSVVVGPSGIILVLVDVRTNSTGIMNETIYAKDLYAVKDGQTLWSFSLGGQLFYDGLGNLLPASVAEVQVSDDLILVGTGLVSKDYRWSGPNQRGPSLFALDANGTMKWNFTVPRGRIHIPVVGKGLIYTVAERFLSREMSWGSGFVNSNSYPLAISLDGRAQWTSGECHAFSALSPGANGEVFGVCYNKTGDPKWQYSASLRSMTHGAIQWETALGSGYYKDPASLILPYKPIVGVDGFVYSAFAHTIYGEAQTNNTDVYGLSVDGDRGWRKALSLGDGRSAKHSMVVDHVKGMVLLTSECGVRAVSQKAVQKTIVI